MLTAPGGLVALWVTNNAQHLAAAEEVCARLRLGWAHRLSRGRASLHPPSLTRSSPQHPRPRQDLLPQWGLRLEARWHWLKVSATGEPLTPLASHHRKPYEVLLLARAGGAALASAPAPVPDQRALVTGTTVFHSEKPPLLPLLRGHVPAAAHASHLCLDIFGRRPRPGVTTLGNEANKLVAAQLFHA